MSPPPGFEPRTVQTVASRYKLPGPQNAAWHKSMQFQRCTEWRKGHLTLEAAGSALIVKWLASISIHLHKDRFVKPATRNTGTPHTALQRYSSVNACQNRYTFTFFHISTDEITVLELYSIRLSTSLHWASQEARSHLQRAVLAQSPRSVCCHVVSTCFVLILLFIQILCYVLFCMRCWEFLVSSRILSSPPQIFCLQL